MAVFVDLDDDDVNLPQHTRTAMKPNWNGYAHRNEAAHESAVQKPANSVTVALGCYPVVSALASQLDLNDIDSLSRTCRGLHDSLLQNRSVLLKSTLRCSNEDLPVDPQSTLRYRARADHWFYMEDTSSSAEYFGKCGSCARDKVAECRKCATVVCRNCAVRSPAPAAFRGRHRRLCLACQKSPIGCLAQPPQSADLLLTSHTMQRLVCSCATDAGVWLCNPCGRDIKSSDFEYRGIWKWRTQYGDDLGGLGTGIGDADRGVECARGENCLSGKFIEHETDCDADDARELEDFAARKLVRGRQALTLYSGWHSWSTSHSNLHASIGSTSGGLLNVVAAQESTRTPSPAVGPGYARHEVEGIGNKIKTVKVSMIRVGGCVPEWKDEKAPGQSLRKEIGSEVRSWCGWCDRVIAGKIDYGTDEKHGASTTQGAS